MDIIHCKPFFVFALCLVSPSCKVVKATQMYSLSYLLATYLRPIWPPIPGKKKCLKGTSKHTMLLDQQKLRNHCMLHYNITECDRYLWRSNCLWTLTLADFSFFSANSQKSSIIIESSLILISYFSKEVSMKIGRLFLRKPCVLHSWPTAWKQLKSSCLVCQVFYANN